MNKFYISSFSMTRNWVLKKYFFSKTSCYFESNIDIINIQIFNKREGGKWG